MNNNLFDKKARKITMTFDDGTEQVFETERDGVGYCVVVSEEMTSGGFDIKTALYVDDMSAQNIAIMTINRMAHMMEVSETQLLEAIYNYIKEDGIKVTEFGKGMH